MSTATFREYVKHMSAFFENNDLEHGVDVLMVQCQPDGGRTIVSGFRPDGEPMSVAEARGLVWRAWDALRRDEETGKHGQPVVAVADA